MSQRLGRHDEAAEAYARAARLARTDADISFLKQPLTQLRGSRQAK
jgi:predicted RNA polymerase sigma factor